MGHKVNPGGMASSLTLMTCGLFPVSNFKKFSMNHSNFICLAIYLLMAMPLCAQDPENLLSLVEEDKKEKKKEFVEYPFKSPWVINSHSIAFLKPGTMDFRILHRFGQVNQGFKTLFGLDQASMRIGFDFGILRNLMVGVGRSTYKRELDGFIKFAPLTQSTGKGSFPCTIALLAGMTMNTAEWQDTAIHNYFSSRLNYYFQAIIGRKFSDGFTLQVMPTMIHKNLVLLPKQPNDVFAIGLGGRIKATRRIAFTWDYSYRLDTDPDDIYNNPLSLGFDIETGGHVFQLHFSNSVGMNAPTFITETTGSWDKGDIRFGFNLSRIFQIKKQKVKV